jgi:hypothetical protein
MKNVFNIVDWYAIFGFEGNVTKRDPVIGYSTLPLLCSMALELQPAATHERARSNKHLRNISS